jgi:HAE1 family hydrophobic/amphiphilic exporter-1
LFRVVGKDFVPHDDQSEFDIIIQTPEGYSLRRTDDTFQAIETRLRTMPEVTHLLSTIGDATGRLRAGEGPVTTGSIYVRLAELEDRTVSQFALMDRARAVLSDFSDLRLSVQNVNLFMSSSQRYTDIQLDLTGPSIDKLGQYADAVMAGMRQTPGFVDVDTTLSVRQPELRVNILRQKAADFGIKAQDIAGTLRTLVGGEPISKYREGQDQYDVWLRAQHLNREDAVAIGDLPIATPRGEVVQLANLATLEEARGPAAIDHKNRQRKVTVVANLSGLTLSLAVDRVREIVAGLDLPPTYQYGFAGRDKSMADTAHNFLVAFLLSIIFMYMILAAQFESFIHPITILLALPLSIPFALVSLVVLDETLNMYSILGLFMLFGIVKKNGILQIDYTNTLRAQGMPRDEAIVRANHVRLRPILMTTVMLVAGMVPIALGRGPGSAVRASMAKVIIGGQALCLLLTLLMTPVAYSLFDDLGSMRPVARVAGWLRLRRTRPAAVNGRTPA